jgi:hypothetical protein
MGNQSSRRPMTTPVASWLADLLTELLDADERQIVRGDIAESGVSGSPVVRDVFGLVIRRQVDEWSHWRPWITLAVLILPLAMILSIVSGRTAGMSSVYLWMYANNWHWSDVRILGFWQVLRESAFLVVISQLTLACWAWTGGFLLGALSRKMVQTNSLMLSLMLLLGAAVGAPLYETFYWQYLHRSFGMPSFPDPNAPVFALAFYRQAFPVIVQAISVVIPAVWGMRSGAVMAKFPSLLRVVLWTAAVASLTVMLVQNPDLWILLRVPVRLGFLQSWQWQIGQMTVYWPVAYFVGIAIKRLTGAKAVPDVVV